jgi:hypothetical protein
MVLAILGTAQADAYGLGNVLYHAAMDRDRCDFLAAAPSLVGGSRKKRSLPPVEESGMNSQQATLAKSAWLLLCLLISNVPIAAGTRVVAWGAGRTNSGNFPEFGQSMVPDGLTNAVAVAAGSSHSLCLKADGTVIAWGDDSLGQTNVPLGLSNVCAIACGTYQSLALRWDGTVAAWGAQVGGCCGIWPVAVPPGLTNVVAIAAGAAHTLALKSDGTLLAWGHYEVFRQTNVPVAATNVVAIACGQFHNLALRADGEIIAWGDNDSGLSTGPEGLSNVAGIACGGFFSLARKSDGNWIGWGSNGGGQLEIPSDTSGALALYAGFDHCLAITPQYTLIGWPVNGGELRPPAGLTNVVGVAIGSAHELALLSDEPPHREPLLFDVGLSGDGFHCSVMTESGRVYRLEYAQNLDQSNWTPLPLFPGNGRPLRLVDPNTGSNRRFYEVRRW